MTEAFGEPAKVSFAQLEGQLANYIASLRCFYNLSEACEYETMNGRYAQGVHLLINMKAKILDIKAENAKGINQRFEIE